MSKSLKILALFMLAQTSICVWASEAVTLEEVALKYKTAKLVEIKVEKTVKSELLGKVVSYEGVIYLAKGMFRWENSTPEKSLLLFDGRTIWSEQHPPKEFGGAIQVAKGLVDKRTKSHILISSLMGEGLDQNFRVVDQKADGPWVNMKVVPIKDGLTLKEINLVIDPAEKTMREISYKDDIGNLTSMKFKDIKFLKKNRLELFKYSPPKGSQVTDL
jgi:outer membrane lipoprotein carrier protein